MKIKVNSDKDKKLRLITGEIIDLKKGLDEIEATPLLAERIAKVADVVGYDKKGNKIKEENTIIVEKEGQNDDEKYEGTSKNKNKKN